jgi:peptidoglycan/LPS O-acetylase OafA/YrhL
LTEGRTLVLSKSKRLALWVAAVIAISILGRFGDFVGVRAQWTYPVATLVCAALLIATIGVRLPVNSWLVRTGCYLGRISYGLYIFHAMFLSLFDVANAANSAVRLICVLAALATTAAVAALSYQFFELPFLRLKQRFATVKSAPA